MENKNRWTIQVFSTTANQWRTVSYAWSEEDAETEEETYRKKVMGITTTVPQTRIAMDRLEQKHSG